MCSPEDHLLELEHVLSDQIREVVAEKAWLRRLIEQYEINPLESGPWTGSVELRLVPGKTYEVRSGDCVVSLTADAVGLVGVDMRHVS